MLTCIHRIAINTAIDRMRQPSLLLFPAPAGATGNRSTGNLASGLICGSSAGKACAGDLEYQKTDAVNRTSDQHMLEMGFR